MILKNKTAIITGGGSGIGLACAKLFCKNGAKVVIFGRRKSRLEKAVCEIGENVIFFQGDITQEKDIKELTKDFLNMIKEKPDISTKTLSENDKTKLMSLSGVKQYPMRVKCATLAWHTLKSAITNSQEEINTERFD